MKDETSEEFESPDEQVAPPDPKSESANSILRAAQMFILDAEALQEVLEVSMKPLMAKEKERSTELQRLIADAEQDQDGSRTFNFRQVHKLLALVSKQRRGGFLLRGHLLVALVSRFDVFVAEVIRQLLITFPDRLNQKSITYSEIAKFSTLEELRQKFIEDEIDQRLRGSHTEIMDYLSSLANVPLGSDEPSLMGRFTELTERRNCHVHTDGKASAQYLRVCSEKKVALKSEVKNGDRLNVSVNYIRSSRRVLSELAFKIAQTVVRKNFEESQLVAEMHLNTIGLEFLNEHKWAEALMVFDYAANLRGKWAGDDSHHKNNIINKAQALIGAGRNEEALKVVESVDWSASHPKYLMAIHLLKREFDEAAMLIPSAAFSESDYRELPIFECFRPTEQFKRAFVGHFGRDFDSTAIGAVNEALAKMERYIDTPDQSNEVVSQEGREDAQELPPPTSPGPPAENGTSTGEGLEP